MRINNILSFTFLRHQMDLQGLLHRSVNVIVEYCLTIQHINWERSTRDLVHGHIAEEICKFRGVHSGRGDNEFQVVPPCNNLFVCVSSQRKEIKIGATT